MSPLQRLLLVLAVFFAQLVAGAHAVEHAAGKDGALPAHTCELCLAAHDLGSALPSLALLPALPPPLLAPADAPPAGRGSLPSPNPRQGAPPFA